MITQLGVLIVPYIVTTLCIIVVGLMLDRIVFCLSKSKSQCIMYGHWIPDLLRVNVIVLGPIVLYKEYRPKKDLHKKYIDMLSVYGPVVTCAILCVSCIRQKMNSRKLLSGFGKKSAV